MLYLCLLLGRRVIYTSCLNENLKITSKINYPIDSNEEIRWMCDLSGLSAMSYEDIPMSCFLNESQMVLTQRTLTINVTDQLQCGREYVSGCNITKKKSHCDRDHLIVVSGFKV